jgi:hypothetical protein
LSDQQLRAFSGTVIDLAVGMFRTVLSASRRSVIAACIVGGFVAAPSLAAGQETAIPLSNRAAGAERVVVGRVLSVSPVWQTNEFGDRLIVSIVRVAVDETMKGQVQSTVDVEVEGGTIGTLTLKVSDLEPFAPGDRAVFYLKRSRRGSLVPHLRGQGLLKLDRADRVPGSNVTLDQVRRSIRPSAPPRRPQ